MKLLDRLLGIFSRQRRTILGAVEQPDDLANAVRRIRAQVYLRITGKSYYEPSAQASKSKSSPSDMSERVSRVRRITRRDA
ncbi:MAG: hypothetical protein ACE5H4_05545 [Candidatus Thorarchaeota archaeon]